MKKARKEAWEEFVGSINERTSSQEMRDKIRQLSGKRKTQQIKKLKGSNGRTITNPKEMADLLAMQFADTSSDEHYSQTFKEKKKKAEETGINIDIFNEENYSGPLMEEELDTALTSPGPDDLHYDFLKQMNRPERMKLLGVYNEIWKTEDFPTGWTEATVIPRGRLAIVTMRCWSQGLLQSPIQNV
jgi:hypothetical protein